ncbi:hypothetical protein BLOT_012020 [Blomia tropicalis]|nr:hypothetical protein BLOT_012020 [Blomia tropicalis]
MVIQDLVLDLFSFELKKFNSIEDFGFAELDDGSLVFDTFEDDFFVVEASTILDDTLDCLPLVVMESLILGASSDLLEGKGMFSFNSFGDAEIYLSFDLEVTNLLVFWTLLEIIFYLMDYLLILETIV